MDSARTATDAIPLGPCSRCRQALDDPRLRRAQALAIGNGHGLALARDLLKKKITGNSRWLAPSRRIPLRSMPSAGVRLASRTRRPSKTCSSSRRGRPMLIGNAGATSPCGLRTATGPRSRRTGAPLGRGARRCQGRSSEPLTPPTPSSIMLHDPGSRNRSAAGGSGSLICYTAKLCDY